ncbi:MAG TPA: Hint domain-containing homing endonuclease, partial [Ktedonobacteraceae bacterium]
MMVLAPVLMMGGAFLILLLLVGGIVFFMVNRAGFLAFMPTVFTGAIELLKWLGVVLVSGLAIKFVFGSAIKDVFAPLIEILLRAWGELRKDRVVHANDNFMAYTGNIKISHHEEIRQNYNIKQIDGPAPVAGLLVAPKNQMYYARDLYERGELFKAITAGRIILGWGEKEGMRKLWMIPRASYFSTIAGGLPASGKCLGKDTPVMLFDGSVIPVQDVHVGDLLMGPDSQPRRVLSTNKGHGPLYRIIPKRGMSWVCNDVHMVTVKDTHSHSAHRGQIKDIPLNEYLACHSNRLAGEKWKLFRVGVEFPDTSVDVDPYLVGLWLGDGTTDEVSFTSQDEQIIQYLVGAAPRYGMQAVVDTRKNCGNAQSIRFRLGTRQAMGGNHMGTDIPNILGCVLLKQCRNAHGVKIIPNAYLKNSW